MDKTGVLFKRRQHLVNSALAVTVVCIQFTILLVATSMSTSETSGELSPTLLVHEMQETINSLATAIQDAAATDPVAKLRQEVIQQVSERDDGLSPDEKLLIIRLFIRDYASVQGYVALLRFDNLRKAWLADMIEEEQNKL